MTKQMPKGERRWHSVVGMLRGFRRASREIYKFETSCFCEMAAPAALYAKDSV